MNARRLETIIISLIAVHSLVLGGAMLFQPARTLDFFGWDYQGTMFFPSQSGIFLVILGGVYLIIVRHRRLAWFIVAAKASAVVFLVSEHFLLGPAAPWAVLGAAVGDGLMGASVAATMLWQKCAGQPPSGKLDDV